MNKEVLTKTGLSKAADEFVNQYTRHLMVRWCQEALAGGAFKANPNSPNGIYIQFALEKKWISLVHQNAPFSSIPDCTYKVLSPGFETAARFLKR